MKGTAATNLADGLANEIKRDQQLLIEYAELQNMPGVFVGFAVARIKQELDFAIDALSNHDIEKMILAYGDLRGSDNSPRINPGASTVLHRCSFAPEPLEL
ncbi:MAG: hypothetical protein H0X33_13345 [Taibaiella sp.]|nr:hypothetical protein [Taibaiella sp.]